MVKNKKIKSFILNMIPIFILLVICGCNRYSYLKIIPLLSGPTFFVSQSGSDATGKLNDDSKPFLTVQAAYEAANIYQIQTNSDIVYLKLEAATFSGIILEEDWNSKIHIIGEGSNVSFLGGLHADGDQSTPDAVLDGRGHTIEVYGSDINLGNVSANGGNCNASGVEPLTSNINWGYNDGGRITIHSDLVAEIISANGGGCGGLGDEAQHAGEVTIESGATVARIEADGLPEWTSFHAGSGGTVVVNGVVTGNVTARVHTPVAILNVDWDANGGSVVVNGSVGGSIDVSGNQQWSGAAGVVTVNGTAGDIIAIGEGGLISPNIIINGQAGNINATGLVSIGGGLVGAGGHVVVSATGVAGNISVHSGVYQMNPVDPAGAAGTIIVNGRAGDLDASGGSCGTYATTPSQYCIGANGGSVTIGVGAVVGNINVNATVEVPSDNSFMYVANSAGTVIVNGTAQNITANGSSTREGSGVGRAGPGGTITVSATGVVNSIEALGGIGALGNATDGAGQGGHGGVVSISGHTAVIDAGGGNGGDGVAFFGNFDAGGDGGNGGSVTLSSTAVTGNILANGGNGGLDVGGGGGLGGAAGGLSIHPSSIHGTLTQNAGIP